MCKNSKWKSNLYKKLNNKSRIYTHFTSSLKSLSTTLKNMNKYNKMCKSTMSLSK